MQCGLFRWGLSSRDRLQRELVSPVPNEQRWCTTPGTARSPSTFDTEKSQIPTDTTISEGSEGERCRAKETPQPE